MADILKISDATALALHSMVHLAIKPAGQSTTAEIAELFDASRHHLAKVHQRLTKLGFLRSHRGPTGGVSLAKDPAKVTLLDIWNVACGQIDADSTIPDLKKPLKVFADALSKVVICK